MAALTNITMNTHYSLLVTRYSLLVTRYSLLIDPYRYDNCLTGHYINRWFLNNFPST